MRAKAWIAGNAAGDGMPAGFRKVLADVTRSRGRKTLIEIKIGFDSTR
jgi:hypothetical protein